MRVTLGVERLLDAGQLAGRRVGLVCNPSSVDGELRHVADRFASHPSARLTALFGPQHGFRSDVQENMIESGHGSDEVRRVPVYSLYSETREPTAEMLADVDVLVIDLQDVGTRIYTYIYTMANCLRAARKHGVKVIVCDRPNPIGGVAVEGPMLEPGFESFVGLFPIPMRHGMTIGELARLFNEHFAIGAELEVVTMAGWRRDACTTMRRGCHGCCRRRTCRRSTRRSSIPARCSSKARTSRKGAARRGRSSWSARRGWRPSGSPMA